MPDQMFGSLYPGKLHPDIEDRRGVALSPMEEAMLIMQKHDMLPHQSAANMPLAPETPLGVQAGMLDIVPGHGAWLLRRRMMEQAAVQADPNIHSFGEQMDPNGPPVSLDARKR